MPGVSQEPPSRTVRLGVLERPTWDISAGRSRDDESVQVGEPVWEDLDTPRALSGDERRLLTGLAAVVDDPLLLQQAGRAVVAAVCRCGCSSVRLCSDGPRVPAVRVAQLSSRQRPDYFCVDAVGRDANRATAQVVLHVVEGRIHELEVCAGEGAAVRLDEVTELTDVTVA